MNEITPEQKRLAELRSRHDRLFKLEKSLNLIVNNPNIPKRDLEKYISQIEDSKNKRYIIRQEIQKIYNAIARKKEHERSIKAGEEDTLHEIEQKIKKLEIQKQRFITDLKNLENSNQIFDKQARINNINNIYKEQEVLMELHNKLERRQKGKEDKKTDEEDDIILENISPLDRAGIIWGEREKKAKHLGDLKMMNDLRQRVINDLGLRSNDLPLDNDLVNSLKREKYLKE
jgi:hypothetical protein